MQINDYFPDPSIIHGVFRVIDSNKNVQDSITFEYHIGRLVMNAASYKRFVNFDQRYQLLLKIGELGADSYTWSWYEIPIPTKYINGEYPKGFINEEYFIVKIFNKSDEVSRERYVFPDDKYYITRVIIPGMSTLIPIKNQKSKPLPGEQ